MTSTLDYPFQHWLNSDGTYDSICLRCFLTVASDRGKEDLAPSESQHNCPGPPLAVPTPVWKRFKTNKAA
jgi:hypothetical protein